MQLLNFQNFYLVGIKGVAMTSIAQCLLDAEKKVAGSDVAEKFVTQKILNQLIKQHGVNIDVGFKATLPVHTDCVIYTAAHQGKYNPQVVQAEKQGLVVFSQAEALSHLFNPKQGIAVCGVGGKSTVSAMITWILEKTKQKPSFSVGVGDIIGLGRTGRWRQNSQYFVAEADEYVIDPQAAQKEGLVIPRFSFLEPEITICTNLSYDHPDVYRDFEHTKEVFDQFFSQIKTNGILVINADNPELVDLARKHDDNQIISFGEAENADLRLIAHQAKEGQTIGELVIHDRPYQLKLKIPGKFNLLNALAALSACHTLDVKIEDCLQALASFNSTIRRFEFKGEKNSVKCYDDYAHHPNEVYQAIQALNDWYPQARKVIAFQSHTFSRTKELFDDFVDAFREAKEVVMIDIFPSAREKADASVNSDLLCEAINKKYPQIKCQNVKTIDKLAEFLKNDCREGDVCITLGAGDIYEVHELI